MSGETAVVRLTGDADITRAPAIREELTSAVDNRHAGLVVDLTETTYLDSAAVNVLFEVAETLRDHQLRMALVIPAGGLVERVVRLVDLDSVAPIRPDVDAALAYVREGG
jgi:anti-anti-sigma factor